MNQRNRAALWRNRDYMLLWGGQVVSTLGGTATTVVYPLLILALTASPQAAGLAGALRAAPYLVLSLPVGALIDRWDRKRVMILCDVGRGLAALSITVAMAFEALTLWQIYAAVVVEVASSCSSTSRRLRRFRVSSLRRSCPKLRHKMKQDSAPPTSTGPSFGTILYQEFGRAIPFLADAISYAVSVASLLRISAAFHLDRAVARRHLAREVSEGLRWLWHNRLIRSMALLTGGLNLINAGTLS